MCNDSEKLVLYLKKSQKDYIEKVAEQTNLSIEHFVVLCAIAVGNKFFCNHNDFIQD